MTWFATSSYNVHEVDDWLSYMTEMQRLCVTEKFYGGEGALSWFITLPGAQKPFQREEGGVQLHWWLKR